MLFYVIYWIIQKLFVNLQPRTKLFEDMTAMQMNAEILRNMSIIAEDENLLKRAAKYLRKLVSEKEVDPTLLTKEEFFARVDEAREQIKRGEGVEMLPDESLDEFLQRVG